MTDGMNTGTTYFNDFVEGHESLQYDVPVFTIAFGDADWDELERMSEVTNGRTFDGRDHLAEAFRAVKGYN